MPQAEAWLAAKWDEGKAIAQLGSNFSSVSGVFHPLPGYDPTDEDMEALMYMVQEWDYAYDPAPMSKEDARKAYETRYDGINCPPNT